MIKASGGIIVLLLAGMFLLKAQSNSTTSSSGDNPLAGLNLNDPGNPATPAGFASRITRHLVILDGDRLKTFDSSTLQNVKYWAFYYSASWCPPCRAFTPKLVEFYKAFKAQHPNFELIFVNEDQSEDDMIEYMKADAMSWPAVRFDDIQNSGSKKYCGSGIPDLVLVDENGKVLSDSFNGTEYRGPEVVMQEIEQLVH